MGTLQRITSGRAELAVEVVGQGNPVDFLHANVCDSRMWGVQLRELQHLSKPTLKGVEADQGAGE